MIRTIDAALQVYGFSLQLLRLGESPFFTEDGSEGIHRHNRVMVLGSKYAPLFLKCLASQFFCFLEASFQSKRAGQIPHRNQRVRVLWPECAALTVQRLALKLLCLRITSLLVEGTAQTIHRAQRF